MRILLKREATISDMQEILDMDRHTVDLRLTKLREASIVFHKQQGRWLVYRICPEAKQVIQKLLTSFYNEVKWDPNCLSDDEKTSVIQERDTSNIAS
jgi:predicted transcriptional regulator